MHRIMIHIFMEDKPHIILNFAVGRLCVIRFEHEDPNKDYIKSFESEKDLNEFWETYSTDLNLNKLICNPN